MKIIDLSLDYDQIRKRIEIDKAQYKVAKWAEITGNSRNVISNIHGKSGKHKPSLQYIIAVAKATGKPIEWYLYGLEAPITGKCPICGDWTDEVREACRKLQEIMESGDEETKSTILGTLNVYRRSIEKKGKRKAKKDLPDVQPEVQHHGVKRKQTAAR